MAESAVAAVPPGFPGARRVVFASCAAATVGVLPVFLLGAMAVQVRQALHFGVPALGATVTIFFASSAVGSAPLGRIVERVGVRAAFRVSSGLSALAMAGIALLVHRWSELLPFLVLAGMANALAGPAANYAIARSVPASRRCLSFGLKQSAIPVATLTAGLAVPVLALHAGWRATFICGAVLALVISAAAAPLVSDALSARPAARSDRGRTLSTTLVVLALASMLGSAPANSLGAFTVDSAVAAGASPGYAALLLSLGSCAGLAIRLLGGWWGDRAGRRRLVAVAGLLAVGSLGFALLATSSPGALLAGVIVSFGAGWGWPGLFQFAVVHSHPQAPAAATGIAQVGSYGGAAVGPLIFGLVASDSSYSVAWGGAGVAGFAAAALVLYARSRLQAGGS